MKKIFATYVSLIMVLAVVTLGVCHYLLATRNIEREMTRTAVQQLEQVADTLQANQVELRNLKASLEEDYLTRAHAFAYIIEQNPSVLDKPVELERIKIFLNVDELHVADENGILRYGTVPAYFGINYADHKQTGEFMAILENPELVLVQELQPNAAEEKMCQYIGVARTDAPGFVQIGLYPERYVEAQKRNELNYIFDRIPMEEYWFIEAIDAETGEVRGKTRALKEEGHEGDAAKRKQGLEAYEGGKYHSGLTNGMWWTIKEYKSLGIYLCIAAEENVLKDKREEQMRFVILYLVVVFLIVLFSINYLLKHKIINGIDRIINALRSITEGNLDMVVREEGNPEFVELSNEINKMVDGLLHTTARISNIIDMVDAPIGSFEYMEDMSRVLTTNRLQSILGLGDAEAEKLFSSKRAFFLKLQSMMRVETEEKGIYKVSEKPAKWLKIQIATENRRTFGIITDVTKEMRDRELLRKERDYDSLTGLYSRRFFEVKVKKLLEQGDEIREAAMVMMDLDYFKTINDTYGHAFGDTYLRFMAELLCREKGENCIIGRRSGDEFYLFAYHCSSREEIRLHLKSLYRILEENPIQLPDGGKKTIELSAGIAYYEEGCTEYEMLLKAADDMLYQMKRSGKGYFLEE